MIPTIFISESQLGTEEVNWLQGVRTRESKGVDLLEGKKPNLGWLGPEMSGEEGATFKEKLWWAIDEGKVLEGELDEAVYGKTATGELRLERSGPMTAGVTYAHEGFVHGCVASTRCFTLQVYSPPYRSANAYDADGATTKIPTHVRGDRIDGDRFTEPASPVLHDH